MARLCVSPGLCIGLAAALLLLPLPWLAAAAAAAGLHELGHLAALRLAGIRVRGMRFSALGGQIQTAALSPGRELLCTAAGPLASLLAALAYPVFPRLALCALAQGVFNLLPCYPMDGGRMLHIILRSCFGLSQQALCRAELIGLGIIMALVFALSFWARLGLALPLLALIFAANAWIRKKSLQT